MLTRYQPSGKIGALTIPIALPAALAAAILGVLDAALVNLVPFVIADATPHALWLGLERATRCWHDRKLWQRIQQNGMRRDFSWQHVAHEYVTLYRDALAAHT